MLINTSAKDFGKYPELIDAHMDRVLRASDAADRYMAAPILRKVGIMLVHGFAGLEVADLVAREIEGVAPGDAKRPDTLLEHRIRFTPSQEVARKILGGLQGLMPGKLDEVGQLFRASTYLQHLYNRPDDGDKQKVFHSDTFFPALKFWYFPRAVGLLDGPLWYVPNSPRLTLKLIAWHKARMADIKAGRVEAWRGPGHIEGSLRISEEEIAGLGLVPMPVTVEADTLVIANVFGFHRRGDTMQPTHRLCINGSIRTSRPFA